jgi:hypothetical protein
MKQMSYNNDDYLKSDCGFFIESTICDFIPCKLKCPLNETKICNRWDICFIAKNISRGKK